MWDTHPHKPDEVKFGDNSVRRKKKNRKLNYCERQKEKKKIFFFCLFIAIDQLTRPGLKTNMEYRDTIRQSDLYEDIKKSLDCEITTIRCLALGSPSESKNAKYQLALLLELQDLFDAKVSVYDPIFNDKDKELLDGFTIEEEFTSDSEKTLYFLPHASLELTEHILNINKPKYFLANDVVTHTDRLTKKKLADMYPSLSILVHLLEDNSTVKKPSDGFTTVSRRKKFKEPVIDYNIESVYFDKVQIHRYLHNSKQAPWGTSFTDLAYHYIT